MKKVKIAVLCIEISVVNLNEEDYISISDLAGYKDVDRSDYILQNWMRNRSTIEFIGLGNN